VRGPAEGLVEYVVKPDGSVDVGPLLAKSWSQENNQVYTFQLAEGVKFHDGTPFNAQAVKFNFDRLAGLKLTPIGRLPKIASVEPVGEYAVRFSLEGPTGDFLYPMTQMLMLSPKAIQDHVSENDLGRKWAAENIVGTGPYTIENRAKGSETTLVKNREYWRGWQGNHLEKIIVRLVKEPATQKLLLERGEAHLVKNVAFTDIDG
jgi:ABC-type transport system substrate-binding protein